MIHMGGDFMLVMGRIRTLLMNMFIIFHDLIRSRGSQGDFRLGFNVVGSIHRFVL